MMVVAGYHAHWRDLISSSLGGMAERTNALVLKTSVVKATEGSNPSPSATKYRGACARRTSEATALHTS